MTPSLAVPQHWIGSHPWSLVVVIVLAASFGAVVMSWFSATRGDEETVKLRAELREAMKQNAKLREDLNRARKANVDAIAVGVEIAPRQIVHRHYVVDVATFNALTTRKR